MLESGPVGWSTRDAAWYSARTSPRTTAKHFRAWHTNLRIGSHAKDAIITGMIAPKPKLRWFQFRLRSLLIFVTLCALPCSWLAVKRQEARRQREAIAAIKKLGGDVFYDWQHDAKGLPVTQPPGPAGLRNLLGFDFFDSVYEVVWRSNGRNRVTDNELELLTGFADLCRLDLSGTQVTDIGLENLKGLSQLKWLDLYQTKVTDAGVKKLQQALPNCRISR